MEWVKRLKEGKNTSKMVNEHQFASMLVNSNRPRDRNDVEDRWNHNKYPMYNKVEMGTFRHIEQSHCL